MLLKDRPIRWKLMAMILLTSGVVLLLTCAAFFAYEFLTFRQATVRELSTLGEIIAANSTAALAFDNQADAKESLSALKAQRHIVSSVSTTNEEDCLPATPRTWLPAVFPPRWKRMG